MVLSLVDRLVAGKLSAAAMALGVLAYRQGERKGAGRLMGIAARAAPRDALLQSHGASAAAKAGDFAMALRLLERALSIEPDRPEFIVGAAVAQCELGDVPGAVLRCEQAVARISDRDPGYELLLLLAQLRMPGPDYLRALQTIHDRLRPRTYVEVGVADGNSVRLAGTGTRVIGIDPAPDIQHPLPAGVRIEKQTSDEFFARNDLPQLFGGLPVDLAFIDGMHQFGYALRDFINLERHCTDGSTILLHDCWPLDRRTASRDRTTQFWTGDVWRILPALRKYRPSLRIRTIAAAPSGLSVVRGLDPKSRVLAENHAEIMREFAALDFSAFEANREAYLGICANDVESIARILA